MQEQDEQPNDTGAPSSQEPSSDKRDASAQVPDAPKERRPATPPSVEEARATFSRKVPVTVKWAVPVALLIIILFSLFSGTYSFAMGHGPADTVYAAWCYFFDGSVLADNPDLLNLATSFIVIRLPRVLLVLLVGAALSSAGAAFQGMFRNPLVSPDLLGASAGASLGACLAILWQLPNILIQLFAFVGGLLAVSLTVWMRRYIRSDAVLGLVLAGMLVSTLFESGMSFIKLVADTNDVLPEITYWLMGEFAGVNLDDCAIAIIPMLIGFILIISQAWKLNVMSFGDEEAKSLGVNTSRSRVIVILGATLVTSTSVAVAGVIGWVGLVIPHFARALVGPNYRVLLPTCILLGAAYLLVIDDIARMALSVEIPIGILTSILGVPFFLVIFRRTSRGW